MQMSGMTIGLIAFIYMSHLGFTLLVDLEPGIAVLPVSGLVIDIWRIRVILILTLDIMLACLFVCCLMLH